MMALRAGAKAKILAVVGTETGINLSGFISSITGAFSDFTTDNLATILVAALGLTVGLAIAWFAYRFIKGRVAKAMKSGKI